MRPFTLQVYYRLKPIIPRPLRMGARRMLARLQLRRSHGVWPIDPSAGAVPHEWPGWPEGKRFAFVLTHDVEGPIGLGRCARLMEIERRAGFRSSFGLIPEGPYRVSEELRRQLSGADFEITLHDWRHDGMLYSSRRHFRAGAARINHFLKEWDVCGFRSGYMLHRMDWLHEIDAKYDSSTFDTDPFEPQPSGVKTVFPFWVAGGDRENGYAELPYTLAQDSTLFLVLQQRDIETWKQKLDWIAERGGMALVCTHPDYMQMAGTSKDRWEYPISRYEELLAYVRARYEGQYWQALPREVADFVSRARPRRRIPPKRICMVSFSNYETDNRVMRYAEALASEEHSVDVFALKSHPEQSSTGSVRGVNVFRLQSRRQKNQTTKLAYLMPILRFWVAASLRVGLRHLRRSYDLVHVHNVPDFLVFAAWLPKLAGAKVILDIHDIVPEFYASKFHLKSESFGVRLLLRVERVSARFANHVIISNHLWRKKYAARTGANGKCSVILNHVNTEIFRHRPRTRSDGKAIVLFPGGLQWHQGLDIAIRAFRAVIAAYPAAEFHVYGDGNMKSQLVQMAADLGLAGKVRFFEPLPLRQIADVMANADVGVVPKRTNSFGNEAYSTKIMEFMSVGVPVVVSNTRIDKYYFDDGVVRFFESENPDALAESIIEVLGDASLRQRLVSNALEYVARNSWAAHKADYLHLIE